MKIRVDRIPEDLDETKRAALQPLCGLTMRATKCARQYRIEVTSAADVARMYRGPDTANAIGLGGFGCGIMLPADCCSVVEE